MPAILIVCTANICRSPMGEGLLKHMLAKRADANEWEVDSAGTYADFGYSPAPYSTKAMLKRGIDISKHRSQPITNDLLRHFDLILTMERFHKEKLRDVFPEDSDRIYMITEMTGVCEDIPDPIDHGAEDYEATAKLLERTFNSSLNWIVELATKNHKKRQDLLETRA